MPPPPTTASPAGAGAEARGASTVGGAWGYGGWGVWGIGGPDIATTSEEPRTMGIMSVDLYDVSHSQLVWRGQATVDSVSNSQGGDEKQVKSSVVKMFKKYPPK